MSSTSDTGRTEFALQLFKAVAGSHSENVFISPYSISMAMSMVLLGSKCNSADQLKNGLGLSNLTHLDIHGENLSIFKQLSSQKNVTLEIANKVFPELSYTLLEEFVSNVTKFYETETHGLDFINKPEESRLLINEWVSGKTNEKIQNLLPSGSINSMVRLVLANAVYFKGNWEAQFKKQDTKKAEFFIQQDKTTTVEMMSRKGKYKMGYDQKLKVQIIELPYKGEEVSMVVLLPTDRFGLNKLESDLTGFSLISLVAEQNFHQSEVILSLPKMKLEYSSDMVKPLQQLGILDVFDISKANLSGISGVPDLFVSSVAHKAFIEVNEEGSEAAAATAAVMMMRSMPMRMTCDHPFLFLIKHISTNTILFIGRLISP